MKNEETKQTQVGVTCHHLVGMRTAKTRDPVKPAGETGTSECVRGHRQCEAVVKCIVQYCN
jgi:hypothetical protein